MYSTVCTVCAYGRFRQVQYRRCIVAFPIAPARPAQSVLGVSGSPILGRLILAGRDAGEPFDVSGPERKQNRLPSFCM